MTLSIFQLFYLFVTGLLLALLEIEIEDENGWAKNLPTKRFKTKLMLKLGKELTGYHLALQTLLILFFHLPLVLNNKFNLDLEIIILTQYALFIAYWDFMWFVLNPKFRLKNFKKGGVPWHQTWFIGLPIEYWLATFIFIFLPIITFGWPYLIIQLNYLITYLIFIILTILFFYLFFKKRL